MSHVTFDSTARSVECQHYAPTDCNCSAFTNNSLVLRTCEREDFSTTDGQCTLLKAQQLSLEMWPWDATQRGQQGRRKRSQGTEFWIKCCSRRNASFVLHLFNLFYTKSRTFFGNLLEVWTEIIMVLGTITNHGKTLSKCYYYSSSFRSLFHLCLLTKSRETHKLVWKSSFFISWYHVKVNILLSDLTLLSNPVIIEIF